MADPKATEVDFGSVLKAEMVQVNELQEAAQVAAEDFMAGRRDDIESVLFRHERPIRPSRCCCRFETRFWKPTRRSSNCVSS